MPTSMLLFQGPIEPINITAILAVFMGISIVLIPVIGITARFALKPTVEAFSRLFEGRGANESINLLERRMSLIESQIDSIEANVRRLADVSEFHHKLEAGASSPSADTSSVEAQD